MSAYLVEEQHINYLLSAALSRRISWHGFSYYDSDKQTRVAVDQGNAEAIGQMLWNENGKSVDYRYSQVSERPVFTLRRLVHHSFDPVQVLKAIDSYTYQACEHPEWVDSTAHDFCQALQAMAISSLPGYEDAAWGAPK